MGAPKKFAAWLTAHEHRDPVARHTFPNGKKKTLDLAIGTPKSIKQPVRFQKAIYPGEIDRVLIACEAKTVMTKHGKSQPRVFDELGSSHEIVHQGDREALRSGGGDEF